MRLLTPAILWLAMNVTLQKLATGILAILALPVLSVLGAEPPPDLNTEVQQLKARVGELEQKVATGGGESSGQAGYSVVPGKLLLSGEGGVAFFDTQSQGQFPDNEFRVDEARLFLDAEVHDDVYFFGELNLLTRESGDDNFRLGELYLDFEELSRSWGNKHLLNARAGRFDIPFGEEYLTRDAIDNPLIMHSLSDIWGIDEGVEVYGSASVWDYALAVQNGGDPSLHDYNSDKAVTARIGVEPAHWLRLSASAMRTGDLNVDKDQMSALWIGNGFIRALGDPSTTTTVHGELAEGDLEIKGSKGHIKAAAGGVSTDDNDTTADNHRDIYYHFVEGVYLMTDKLYAATRWSRMTADNGYPLVGDGNFSDYYYGPLTKELWRWTAGVGYRWSHDLVIKADYSFEGGKEVDGTSRDKENFLGVEAAFHI